MKAPITILDQPSGRKAAGLHCRSRGPLHETVLPQRFALPTPPRRRGGHRASPADELWAAFGAEVFTPLAVGACMCIYIHTHTLGVLLVGS